jgi:hypothetical protein
MTGKNRRRYFREDLIVPARWYSLTDQEVELVEKGLGSALFKRTDLPSPIDELMEQVPPSSDLEPLYRCFQLLNNKLDFIIDQIFLKTDDRGTRQGKVLEISGSGLRFHSSEELEVGSFLRLNLIIPGTFQYQLDLIIKTIRVDRDGDGFITAGEIVEISEEDRDAIIKVVMQKQRSDIRRQKLLQEGHIG